MPRSTVGTFGVTTSRPSFIWNEQWIETSIGSRRPGHFPGVGISQPVIRVLDLPAVLDLLAEHAVFVAQSVTDGRDLEGRHRVEEAGGQTAESAVAQPGVGLLLAEVVPVPIPVRGQIFADVVFDLEIGDRVGQRPADEELHRQIIDLLRVLDGRNSGRVNSHRWASKSRTDRARAS